MMDDPMDLDKLSRKERLAARKEGHLDTTAFLKTAGKFIDVANRANKKIQATELHIAFLYAAARYNAHVANTVLEVTNHEDFVEKMTKQYQEMLRQHLADPNLGRSGDENGTTDKPK